jgi:hypothetical protein
MTFLLKEMPKPKACSTKAYRPQKNTSKKINTDSYCYLCSKEGGCHHNHSPPKQYAIKRSAVSPVENKTKDRSALQSKEPKYSILKHDSVILDPIIEPVIQQDISVPVMYFPSRKEVMENNVPYCNRCLVYGHKITECQMSYMVNSTYKCNSSIPYCSACLRSGHKTEECFSLCTIPLQQKKNIVPLKFQHPTTSQYMVRNFIKKGEAYSYCANIYSQPSKYAKVISVVRTEGIINTHAISVCGTKEKWLTTYIETGEIGYTCIVDNHDTYLQLI